MDYICLVDIYKTRLKMLSKRQETPGKATRKYILLYRVHDCTTWKMNGL